MIKTSAVDGLLARLIKMREQSLKPDDTDEPSLYGAMCQLHAEFGGEGDDFPPAAYSAAADIVRRGLIKLASKSNTDMANLLELIQMLEVGADGATIAKLKLSAQTAATGYLFTLGLCQAALSDADYAYLVEIAVEAGKKAAAVSS